MSEATENRVMPIDETPSMVPAADDQGAAGDQGAADDPGEGRRPLTEAEMDAWLEKHGGPEFARPADDESRLPPADQTNPAVDATGETPDSEDDAQAAQRPKVDYDQEIPLPNVMGEEIAPMRLGELKDDYVRLRRQSAKVERLEGELMRERLLVNQVLANDGQPLTDEQRQQFDELRQTAVKRQVQATLSMFPEWADADTFARVKPELERVARDVGFTPAEIPQLTHPSILVMLERLRRYEAADSTARAAMQNTGQVRKGRPAPARQRRRASPDAQRADVMTRKYKSTDEIPFGAIDRMLFK